MLTPSPRGRLGTMPAATTLDDESYLDFVEGMYGFARRVAGPAAARAAHAEVERRFGGDAQARRDIAALRAAFEPLPAVAARNRIYRSAQELMWRRIRATYDRTRPAFEDALEAAAREAGDRLQLRDEPLPDYYVAAEFHLQPGSYHGHPLAGLWYHYGSKIVFLGANDEDRIHGDAAARTPAPGAEPAAVLDLACSIGQSTTALKRRFPGATITGIDVSAPMLKYANWRARDLGVDVRFRQCRAEATGLPSGSVDLVFALLLFHELPASVAVDVLAEAHRLLRPGGLFVIVDNATGEAAMTPFRRYTSDFSRRYNGERYGYDFDTSDFVGTLRSSPFADVRELAFEADVQLPFSMWALRR